MVAFPHVPEDLTLSWLTRTLRASGATRRAAVVSFDCGPLAPHVGMTGTLVRLRLHYDVAEPGAPATLVAKFSAPDPGLRGVVHGMGFFEREVRFYSELAGDTPACVPRCYFAAVEPAEGWSLLLLEDLVPARNGSWVRGSTVAEVELVLDVIAAVHAAWWEHPRLETADWLAMTSFLTPAELPQVAAQAWGAFLARLSAPHTPVISEAGRLVLQHAGAVGEHLFETAPRTLIHHDLDGDNLFFPEVDGRTSVVLIDWQLATRAHPAVDVAWWVAGHLDPPVRREHEHDLVAGYHERLVEHGVAGYGFDQCWDDYRMAMLIPVARIASAVGLTAGPVGGHWDVTVPRYCQAVHDLEVEALLQRRVLTRVRG